MNYLENYYNAFDEDGRLLSKHGQVEYLTTIKYINECLVGIPEPLILEIGAGTGRYSVELAKRGYQVTAVELISHNLELLNAKLDGSESITVMQDDALDLSALPDAAYDVTMLLGPMYHLYTRKDKKQALSEAVRVTRPGGFILVAYCMNEATIIQYAFKENNIKDLLARNMITPDWHCISEAKDVFEMVRTEEIASLNAEFPIERIKLVATDGASRYMSETINAMDDETFANWMDYHFAICERQDLIGASNHTLDILRKHSEVY